MKSGSSALPLGRHAKWRCALSRLFLCTARVEPASALVYLGGGRPIDDLPRAQTNSGMLVDTVADLWDLRAIRLRASLFWRDHAIDVAGRVDQRLLASLDALSHVLIQGAGVSRKLSAGAANGLIGRFLYVYFLADRGTIHQNWVAARKHGAINLTERRTDWPADATWSFFDDLNSILNGSIFPMGVKNAPRSTTATSISSGAHEHHSRIGVARFSSASSIFIWARCAPRRCRHSTSNF